MILISKCAISFKYTISPSFVSFYQYSQIAYLLLRFYPAFSLCSVQMNTKLMRAINLVSPASVVRPLAAIVEICVRIRTIALCHCLRGKIVHAFFRLQLFSPRFKVGLFQLMLPLNEADLLAL